MDNDKPDCHPSYGTVGFYRMYGNKPTSLFDSKASISKTDRKEILNKLHKIVTMSKQNEAFILKQFQRQTERTILEAKQEFEAFTQQKLLDLQLSDKDVPITGLLPEVTQSTEK